MKHTVEHAMQRSEQVKRCQPQLAQAAAAAEAVDEPVGLEEHKRQARGKGEAGSGKHVELEGHEQPASAEAGRQDKSKRERESGRGGPQCRSQSGTVTG